ncbi:MAG: sulfite oxidase heme-binding subunit YedZ [Gammaproteobacteria bacterium]
MIIKLSTFSVKCLLFFIALIPFSVMVWRTLDDDLGANPVEMLTQLSGLWSLRFLLITLSLTPLRMLFKLSGVIKYRRMLGLFTFFYSSIHFAIFIILEHALSLSYIVEDIYTNPTVDVGLLAYLLLIPLALTSTNKMMRKLGRLWKKLHISVHVIALLSILHFALSEKADFSDPLFYGVILLALLVVRGVVRNKKTAL